MNLLALDTASAACSVAVSSGGDIIASQFEEMARGHASALIPMVDKVMKESGLEFKEIDGFAVSIGPGAFTGLRIALSSARAFGLAHKKPVYGVTTMEAIALQASLERMNDHIIVSALDAKRADIYAQSFEHDLSPRQDAIAVLPEMLPEKLDCADQKVLIAGDSFDRISGHFMEAGCKVTQSPVKFPDARYVAKRAARRLDQSETLDAKPLYIRPPDAALPKNGGRLRP